MAELLKCPRLLQVGSTGRNSGKTIFAQKIVKQYKELFPIFSLKIVTIKGKRGVCQRGGLGCGMCTSIDEGFELIEEVNRFGNKDTMKVLRAGSQRAFLLKAFEDSLVTGFEAFLKEVPDHAAIITESNSLRKYVEPGAFVMIHNHKVRTKPSAADVYDMADVIVNDADDPGIERIKFHKNPVTQQVEWGKVDSSIEELTV